MFLSLIFHSLAVALSILAINFPQTFATLSPAINAGNGALSHQFSGVNQLKSPRLSPTGSNLSFSRRTEFASSSSSKLSSPTRQRALPQNAAGDGEDPVEKASTDLSPSFPGQFQKRRHQFPNALIENIQATVNQLSAKAHGHGKTAEQLTKALEHTNRILRHISFMNIVKGILEQKKEALEQQYPSTDKVKTGIYMLPHVLLGHMDFEKLKEEISGVLGQDPALQTRTELAAALDFLDHLSTQTQEKDEQVELVKQKVGTALKSFDIAMRINNDFEDWSAPPE